MNVAANELWRMSTMELAEAIRRGQVSSREVVEAHLRRIEEVNPSINAVTILLGKQALEAARAADRTVAAGDVVLPLHGIPFTVKDNIDVAAPRRRRGSRHWPTRIRRGLLRSWSG